MLRGFSCLGERLSYWGFSLILRLIVFGGPLLVKKGFVPDSADGSEDGSPGASLIFFWWRLSCLSKRVLAVKKRLQARRRISFRTLKNRRGVPV
jgi:hypothetical protein